MTLPQIYERIGSLPDGGYLVIDSRFDPGYIYSLCHTARAVIASERWKVDKDIPYTYYQTFIPEYSVLAQSNTDGCFISFYGLPQIIALDGRATGMGFVGTINGKPCTFREVTSRATFASMQTDRVMKAGREPYILLLPGGEFQVWYQDAITELKIDAVFADPTKLPDYNVDIDDYPIDQGDVGIVERLLMQGSMRFAASTPIDRINDSRDTTVAPFPNK